MSIEEEVGRLIVVFGTILISMTLHEAMHGYVAYLLGDDTAKLHGRLSLNPIKHIDPILTLAMPITLFLLQQPIFGGAKPVPLNPTKIRYGEWGAAAVALAGPLTNLVLAFFFFGLFVLFHSSAILAPIFVLASQINLGFFVFNILPIPPLDGSRFLYALAPEMVRRGMEAIEQYGLIFVFAIVIFTGGLIGTYMQTTISFFLELFSWLFRL